MKQGWTLEAGGVLDIGCGTGFFTGYYLDRGAEVTGLDIATVSIERLRERFPSRSLLAVGRE